MRTIRIKLMGSLFSGLHHPMIVCVCHRVSDRDIVRSVHEGCSTFEDLQEELGCGTRCGSCRACAH
ncbi:MAG TPA: (2Fe-2S)-binding protein, partial [Burkholderiaceae bacterium]|nr:(2Fe-2S)-binding protein [Burkholderiaceae bacterium]